MFVYFIAHVCWKQKANWITAGCGRWREIDRNKTYWKIKREQKLQNRRKKRKNYKASDGQTVEPLKPATIRMYFFCVSRESNRRMASTADGAHKHHQNAKCARPFTTKFCYFELFFSFLFLYFASIRRGYLNHSIFFSQLNDLNLICVLYAQCAHSVLGWFTIESTCQQLF